MPRYMISALVVACAMFMEQLDATVIATSLPAIALDLNEDPISLKLAMTSYLVSLAIFIPVSGWVADRFGAKNVFRAAVLVFTLGSIFCGLSRNLPELVGARIIQGLGGALMTPVGRLVLMRSVERRDLVRALSFVTIPALLGPIAGPLLGGFITTYFHWRCIFWINVPIGALGMALATFYIDNVKPDAIWPLDFRGFFLSGAGLAAMLFGLATAGRGLAPVELSLALTAIGALTLAAYAAHARRAPFPLLDLKLFSLRTFRASVLGGALFRVGIGSIPFLLPLMLQMSFGMNPFQSGSITFISSAGAMAMKGTAPHILRRFGFRWVLIVNALLSGVFLAAYGLFWPSTPILLMMGLFLVGGFIHSLEFTSLNAIVFAEIGHERMSQAVSLASVGQQLSLSLGIAAGAAALQGIAALHPGADVFAAENFRWAFLIMGLVSMSSALSFMRLPPDAGADIAGRGATQTDEIEAAGE
ncbi:drug resistance transporter, EmrB/QacA subfamily [Methylocapsa palsarum]|uniref:Drug resistance transporter, EmrB/QacA subfamily n=1 Tax=Methylocapsa palsarum TaxID=1612308 RepID=A0A1I3XWB4_9HYPH|nr:drug resistance transporter, EmrB/QacA subfamily [Methylocapsa palsarum]